jgi:polyhydroxyalkanoate synthesis regulator protein
MAHLAEPVTSKRYAHERLHAGAAGGHVTLDDLAHRGEEAIVVRDAATGDDITPAILKQVIIERAPHG